MNRISWFTAACTLLLGHMSLAQQTDYTTERQARLAPSQTPASLAGQGPNARTDGSFSGQTNAYAQPNAYGQGNGYGQDNGYRRDDDNGRYGQNQPGYPRSYGRDGGYDRRSDIFRIERLDRVVDLNGYQKRDLFRLEQYYDRQFSVAAPAPGVYQRLMWQKSQDVLAILTPLQRNRLFTFEQYRAYNGNGYNNNYGRGNSNAGGRRW